MQRKFYISQLTVGSLEPSKFFFLDSICDYMIYISKKQDRLIFQTETLLEGVLQALSELFSLPLENP